MSELVQALGSMQKLAKVHSTLVAQSLWLLETSKIVLQCTLRDMLETASLHFRNFVVHKSGKLMLTLDFVITWS